MTLTELKGSRQRVGQGSLINFGRGGGMLLTKDTLPLGDHISLRIGGERNLQSEGIVLLGRAVWDLPGRGGYNRYGVSFLTGQGDSYEQLWRVREISHSKLVAKLLGLMFVDLTPAMVEKKVLSYVSRDLAFSLNCMPIKLRGERLMVAMGEPRDGRALEKLGLFSGCKIVPVVATPWAITKTQIQCWGVQYVPSWNDISEEPSFRRFRQDRRPRILVVASRAPEFTGKRLGTELAALLNRDKKRAFLVSFHSRRPVLADDVSDQGEWVILTLPAQRSTLGLDWAIRADETFLVVSPSHWKKGCLYVRAAFDRFVEIQKDRQTAPRNGIVKQRVLELSVVCAQISDMRQGFQVFRQLETSVHQDLDMREPEFDIRVHYIGGILEDQKNVRRAEKMGVPITLLKPHSPASQCLRHIAESLLRPTHARDPRVHLSRSVVSRIFG